MDKREKHIQAQAAHRDQAPCLGNQEYYYALQIEQKHVALPAIALASARGPGCDKSADPQEEIHLADKFHAPDLLQGSHSHHTQRIAPDPTLVC